MANQGYMTITGPKDALISRGCSGYDSIGNKCQTAHIDKIMVLSFVHQIFNLENSKAATHQPVVITKNIDKSTPLLAQALANRDLVDCEIDFYRTSKVGGQEKFFTVKLSGCVIADMTMVMPDTTSEDDAEPHETIGIRYSNITWNHHLASTSAQTSWNAVAWNP
ncbi:Hcp family type VI secretion system effector [Pseudomonas sp.]|uniref:Hcp family type VI secretion system effector n=1 Tax=Pseudomonas sp. TaxID=306 RepID=UPI002607E9B3|nr:Hcp family type VI secretion system effector [Pseudomonas sp.]